MVLLPAESAASGVGPHVRRSAGLRAAAAAAWMRTRAQARAASRFPRRRTRESRFMCVAPPAELLAVDVAIDQGTTDCHAAATRLRVTA